MGLRLLNLEDMVLFTIRGVKLENSFLIIKQGIRNGDQIKMIIQKADDM